MEHRRSACRHRDAHCRCRYWEELIAGERGDSRLEKGALAMGKSRLIGYRSIDAPAKSPDYYKSDYGPSDWSGSNVVKAGEV